MFRHINPRRIMARNVRRFFYIFLFCGISLLCINWVFASWRTTLFMHMAGFKRRMIIPIRKGHRCLVYEALLKGKNHLPFGIALLSPHRNKDSDKGYKYLPELEILLNNTMQDHRTWADASFSRVQLSPKLPRYQLGAEIRVEITLFDGYGHRREKGGDYIRLWMENTQLKASVSGDVTDFNNGTFVGVLKAVWSGSAIIKVLIDRRREELAYFYQAYECYKCLVGSYAEFNNGKDKEESLCSVFPMTFINDEGQEWCNLTVYNDGLPWYCLKPNNTEITCDMWNTNWSAWFNPFFDFDMRMVFDRREDNSVLHPGLTVEIEDNGSSKVNAAPTDCNKLPAEVTWRHISPNGFFYKNEWQATLCTDTLPQNIQVYRECLKGRTLRLSGDSTSRQFVEALDTVLQSSHTELTGHIPVKRSHPVYNFSYSWQPHELPFYHGVVHYLKSDNEAPHVILDSLPNTSRDIIVMYLNVHFNLNHPGVFRRHVRRFVQSAKRLLQRAPKVILAVRGPHAYYPEKGSLLLSYWGLLYADILREEFALLQTRIVYLDYWDMTVARSSVNPHPESDTVKQMVHHMLSLLCFRSSEM